MLVGLTDLFEYTNLYDMYSYQLRRRLRREHVAYAMMAMRDDAYELSMTSDDGIVMMSLWNTDYRMLDFDKRAKWAFFYGVTLKSMAAYFAVFYG